MEAKKVTRDVWKFPADSNCYLVLGKVPFVVDTGRRANWDGLQRAFQKVLPPKEVKLVIFTHLHYDHIGCFDLFPDATFHASKDEIQSFSEDKSATVLDEATLRVFSPALSPIPILDGFEVISCPGHTKGSIALWNKAEGILFSGDTLFFHGYVGRTDLPTSVPGRMDKTLATLKSLPVKHLCPGHEY